MENQKKKTIKSVVIAVIITLLFSAGIVYLGSRTILEDEYYRGYDAGYQDGESNGYDIDTNDGYYDGYNAAKKQLQEN